MIMSKNIPPSVAELRRTERANKEVRQAVEVQPMAVFSRSKYEEGRGDVS